MNRMLSHRNAFAITIAVVTALLAGCGGGGGGGGDEPQPPPPPPPRVEIGPGPGPAADAIPAEPAISTVSARACAFAQAPDSSHARPAAIERIDRFASDLPATEDELRAVLADFTGWVTQDPDDPVSQAGLAAAIVIAGAYNAGIDAGYTSGQVLSLLAPVSEIAAAGLREDDAGAVRTIASAAANFPRPTDPDFSSADLQIGIRKFLLPAISHSRLRLEAVADSAGGPNTRLAEFPSRHGTHYTYAAEFRALGGLMRVGQSVLLQFCAYQFNPGDWDWTQPISERDADDDGLLSRAEYLPPDPFLWRHDSDNMQVAGTHLRGGLRTVIAAVEAAHDDSLTARALSSEGTDAALEKLRDLLAMAEGEVQAEIVYEGGSEGGGSFTTRMNLSRLWSAPQDDLKTFFPKLTPVSGSAWEALPRNASDFPRPQFGGVFPAPEPVLEMLTTGPTYITISHGSVERLTVIDRRDDEQ